MPLKEDAVTKKEGESEFNDNFNISPEEIEKASKDGEFATAGDVTLGDDIDYIEFPTADLIKRLKPFLQKEAVSRDIITRSLQICILPDNRNEVQLNATDSISFLSCMIPAKVNNFPNSVMVDTQSLAIVASTQKNKTYLIHRNGSFYSNFYGGEIYIPTYKLNQGVFDFNVGKEISKKPADISAIKSSLEALSAIVSSSETADLSYVFFEDDGVFASNGTVVGKHNARLPKFKVRQVDINLLIYMLDSIQNESVEILETESFYSVDAQTFSYTFPKTQPVLSDSYKNVSSNSKVKYFLNLPYLNSILNVLAKMPESSGVLYLKFTEDLRGVSKTRQGNESSFLISTYKEGEQDTTQQSEYGVSTKALTIALRVFKGEPSIAVTVDGGKIMFSSENKQCAIILRRS